MWRIQSDTNLSLLSHWRDRYQFQRSSILHKSIFPECLCYTHEGIPRCRNSLSFLCYTCMRHTVAFLLCTMLQTTLELPWKYTQASVCCLLGKLCPSTSSQSEQVLRGTAQSLNHFRQNDNHQVNTPYAHFTTLLTSKGTLRWENSGIRQYGLKMNNK